VLTRIYFGHPALYVLHLDLTRDQDVRGICRVAVIDPWSVLSLFSKKKEKQT
jgi:hypothetical protein